MTGERSTGDTACLGVACGRGDVEMAAADEDASALPPPFPAASPDPRKRWPSSSHAGLCLSFSLSRRQLHGWCCFSSSSLAPKPERTPADPPQRVGGAGVLPRDDELPREVPEEGVVASAARGERTATAAGGGGGGRRYAP